MHKTFVSFHHDNGQPLKDELVREAEYEDPYYLQDARWRRS